MMDAFICDATRTPIGRLGGGLASVRPDDLAAHVIRALLARNVSLDPEVIDEISFGCANQAGEDNRNVARMAALGLRDLIRSSAAGPKAASLGAKMGRGARIARPRHASSQTSR
mgnify:CR=1 FL=1